MSCMIDLRYAFTASESVSTRKPSVTGMLQAISTQLRPSTWTQQMRQLPATDSSGMPAEIGDVEAVGERRLQDGLVALGLDRLPVYEDLGHSSVPLKRDRLCSMKYSNSSRNLFRMPLVA